MKRQNNPYLSLLNTTNPYRQNSAAVMAHELSCWQGRDLRECEKAVVLAALQGIPGTSIRCADYSWYKRLPSLTGMSTTAPSGDATATPLEALATG